MFDILIKNGMIVDGTGNDPHLADVAIKDGKIVTIAPSISERATQIIYATDCYVTPGFIDAHRHGDALVFKENFGEIEIRQGITSTINGNCGLSVVPAPNNRKRIIFPYLKPIIGSVPSDVHFEEFSEYLACVQEKQLPLNFGMLVGNGTLRSAVKGFENGKLSSIELKHLHHYLDDALSSGAFGISTGLVYMPENQYTGKDIIDVLSPLRGTNVPLVTHIRGEGDLLVSSIKEVICIAESLGVPLHISHYKCVGRHNWRHALHEATKYIEEKQEQGMRITCDVYPWEAGATQLVQVLPPEFLEGGLAETTKRLHDSEQRSLCRSILEKKQTRFENQISSIGWESILIASVESKKNAHLVGKRITEIAHELGKDPYDAAFDLLVEEECAVSMVNFIVCQDDIETILKLPYSSVISDSIFPDSGLYHPRVYGSFAKILAEYVREKKILKLSDAIHKMTALPAQIFGIKNKGQLVEGFDADVTVFNLNRVSCNATYIDSARFATGFDYVLVNGKIVNDHDTFINAGSGFVLRKTR